MLRAIGVLVVCGFASVAAAQPSNQVEAEKYFVQGREMLKQNDAPGACAAFEKAIELDPTAPGVMLNLGLCNELQGKFATSLYWFRKAQFAAAEAKPPLPEYEAEAKKHTQDLTDKVLITQLKDVPDAARVSIDGRPVRRDEYARLEVDRDSVVEARVPGKQVFRQKVEVEGTTAKPIAIVLQDEVVPPLRDPGKGRRRLAYIVGAGGVVIYGITLAYGLVVRSRYNDENDGNYDGSTGFQDAKDDLRYKGTGLFLAGTAAIGAAVVLYLTSPKPYRERMEQAHVLPIVTPDQVGFGYTRSF